MKPFFQVGGRRRQDEHTDDIGSRLFPQLLCALPVDVEQHVLPRRQGGFDGRARRAVAMVEYSGPFKQFVPLCHLFEFGFVDKQIIATLDFAGTHRPRGHGYRHRQAGRPLHQEAR